MKNIIVNRVNKIGKEIFDLSKEIYENPELGYEEHKACFSHTKILKKYGFSVQNPYLEMDTAFKAEYKSTRTGPNVAFIAEYDALPVIGHGCGHNLLGAVSSGAGIVLKQIIDEIGGSVTVFGTPAEETDGSKVIFAQKGAFNNIDIALIAHPHTQYRKSGASLAMESLEFIYRGKSTHAAASPEKGINALDAAINTFNNINALRQHIRSDSRIHGIITEGGNAPNVTPDYAVAHFYVRSTTKKYLKELVDKVKKCAVGASMAAGTKIEIRNYENSYDNLIINQKLLEVFCKQLSKLNCKYIEEPLENAGSTDVGNVSHCCPTLNFYWDITNNTEIEGHTEEFAKATLSEYAYSQMKLIITALVMTSVEVIKNKNILLEIKNEFANI